MGTEQFIVQVTVFANINKKIKLYQKYCLLLNGNQ